MALTGGDKLERHLKALADKVTNPGTLHVGFLAGATYPGDAATSVPMVAFIQNYGAPAAGIPPRPYFTNMIIAKSPTWGDALALNLEATGMDAKAALALMGEGIKGQLQQSIIDTNSPPLKPATVKRKGFDKPLIDTSHMINSAAYEVV